MRAVVAGDITITGYTDAEGKEIKEYLSIDDPAYFQKIRINPRLKYALSPQYKYYEEKNGVLKAPRGICGWLAKTFKDISFENQTVEVACELWKDARPIVLRENQAGVPETITQARQGIALLPTGFGKTIIALEVARRLQQRTLIITPKLPIKEQFLEDLRRFYGIDGKAKDSPVAVVTPAYIISQIKRKSFDPRAFGAVFFDECHSSVAPSTKKIFAHLHARYRFGFTGTLDRSDGQAGAVPFYFGDTLIERNETLLTPSVVIHRYTGGGALGEYHVMAGELATDEERNKEIVALIKKGRKALVLTKRIEHYENIVKLLPEDINYFAMYAKDDNSQLLDDLRKERQEYDVILGTYSLLATGLDIPSLEEVILAGDLKSTALQKQSVGRILRLFGEEKKPIIHDIADVKNPILNRQAKLRKQAYEKLGWPITICQMKEQTLQIFPESVLRLLREQASK